MYLDILSSLIIYFSALLLVFQRKQAAVDSVAGLARKILIVSNDDNEDNDDNSNDAIDSNYVNDVTTVWDHCCVMYLAYRPATFGDEARKQVLFND